MPSQDTHSNFESSVLDRLEQIKAMSGLPSPKGPAMVIMRLARRPSTTLPVLAHAIKADPVFSAQLIKVANGVSAGGPGRVFSLPDAVNVLGVPGVRSLALGFSLLANYRSGQCVDFDYERFWSHSLARAVALQALAAAVKGGAAEDAFSVGLLARVGELALASLFPEQYSAILQRHRNDPTLRLFDLEQEAFVATHGVLSASMILDCGLPRLHVEPVYFFEDLEAQNFQDGSSQRIAQHSLALADLIADICLASPAAWQASMPRLFRLGVGLCVEADALVALCNRVAQAWREWSEMLEIAAGPLPHFEECPTMPAPAAGAIEIECLRILVVSDDPRLGASLPAALTALGHHAFDMVDGSRGLAMASEILPQVMLIDRTLAESDGFELTRALRQSKAGCGMHVLMVGEGEDEDKVLRAFEAGVDDFLALPLKPSVLAARLRAGQRALSLRQELARDKEEIRRVSVELSMLSQRLQEATTMDMLTGCSNRRHAMDRIKQEWTLAVDSGRPLACMVISVDNFRRVNDARGLDAGDAVLKLVASVLKDAIRTQDVLARTGGDEFLVICPDTSLETAVDCAEGMRAAVEALPMACGAHNPCFSVSVGVAVRNDATVDADALIRFADQSAYLAKRRRNAVATVQSILRFSVVSS